MHLLASVIEICLISCWYLMKDFKVTASEGVKGDQARIVPLAWCFHLHLPFNSMSCISEVLFLHTRQGFPPF